MDALEKEMELIEPESSILGTAKYWDDFYEKELEFLNEDDVEPEEWFGTHVKNKMVNYILKHYNEDEDKVLDLGVGAGGVLKEFIAKGWKISNLSGLDYSAASLKLANAHLSSFINEYSPDSIKLYQRDLMDDDVTLDGDLENKFRIVLDKGTYDAICLNPSISISQSTLKYCTNVDRFLDQNGIFLIASCNWTATELTKRFEPWFVSVMTMTHGQMTFGGQTGSATTIIGFKKKKD